MSCFVAAFIVKYWQNQISSLKMRSLSPYPETKEILFSHLIWSNLARFFVFFFFFFVEPIEKSLFLSKLFSIFRAVAFFNSSVNIFQPAFCPPKASYSFDDVIYFCTQFFPHVVSLQHKSKFKCYHYFVIVAKIKACGFAAKFVTEALHFLW